MTPHPECRVVNTERAVYQRQQSYYHMSIEHCKQMFRHWNKLNVSK
ncbi:hypothetical protein CPter91_2335 [Collimonas pratensis]|uniref:Uncharacterized protein n=1 Tax=Collimonas pratensis TaxID=279113 RepID=A0A127Q3P2_9BURK|nr:hypothetical protein CPter91_2335 [Collimonas pratensis]